MPVTWDYVPQSVIDIAQDIIRQYHKDLVDARIGFVFRSEASASGGKMVIGNCSTVPPKFKVRLELDYLIWIAQPTWDILDTMQRRALIDHELCHCDYDGDKASTRAHDIEEFGCILERYGLWKSDLFMLQESLQKAIQLPLPISKSGGVVAMNPSLMSRIDRVEVKHFANEPADNGRNDPEETELDDTGKIVTEALSSVPGDLSIAIGGAELEILTEAAEALKARGNGEEPL